jgi:hypothetical protein
MRPDLGSFRDIRCAKAKRGRAGKFTAALDQATGLLGL